MELRHLRYFLAVADELNFTRAALRLHTAQPSLSQQIRDLEDEIGTQLFERSKRKVDLTDAGRVFMAEARLTLAQADRAVARARQVALQRQATLTIGFVPAAEVKIFPVILPMLRMRFPQLNVELRSLPTLEQEDALLRGDIDIAFMRPPIQSTELKGEVVFDEPFILLLPATHPLAALEQVPRDRLNGEAFVCPYRQYSGRVYDVVEEYCATHQIQRNVVQQASNILLNLNLVGMGMGCALLPAYVSALTNESICCRPLAETPPSVELMMVWRADNHAAELAGLCELVRGAFAATHHD